MREMPFAPYFVEIEALRDVGGGGRSICKISEISNGVNGASLFTIV